jgi:hypothetical protein
MRGGGGEMPSNIRVATSAAILALTANAAHARVPALESPDMDKLITDFLTLSQQHMLDKLKGLSIDQLHHVKLSDGCEAGIVDCGDMTSGDLQQLVGVELDRRKADADAVNQEDAAQDRNRTFYISTGSLIVSVLALAASLFSMFRKGEKTEGAA